MPSNQNTHNKNAILIIDDDSIFLEIIGGYFRQNISNLDSRQPPAVLTANSIDSVNDVLNQARESGTIITLALIDLNMGINAEGGNKAAKIVERHEIYFSFISISPPSKVLESLNKSYDRMITVIQKSTPERLFHEISVVYRTAKKLRHKDKSAKNAYLKGLATGLISGLTCHSVPIRQAKSMVDRQISQGAEKGVPQEEVCQKIIDDILNLRVRDTRGWLEKMKPPSS